MNNMGYFKVSACSFELKVANTAYNADKIIENIEIARKNKVDAICFPELSITGYTCADLFLQDKLLDDAEKQLLRIAKSCKKIITIVGLPLRRGGRIYNCAAVISDCELIGIVPKQNLPSYNEYYEKRWFAEGNIMPNRVEIGDSIVPSGVDMVFLAKTNNGEVSYGVEICEDMWVAEPPSSKLCKMGSHIIFNPSASTEFVSKHNYRRALIAQQSGRGICGYVYAGAARSESTTDVVFSGYTGIFENGTALKEGERFKDYQMITSDIDVWRINFLRAKNTSFSTDNPQASTVVVHSPNQNDATILDRYISPYPFVPSGEDAKECLNEIISIQVSALIKRMEHIRSRKAVVGISGGVDSTLCLLVACKAFDERGWDKTGIIAITMPGFGTTSRTKSNAEKLSNLLGCTLKDIDIKGTTTKHFCDIGHDGNTPDLTYENAQARERTQIIMDVANMEGALALGTGDLSELALGWCTYNADHMSMYNVNCSIPKTLARPLTAFLANMIGDDVKEVVEDILKTPFSPELIPAEGDEISQKTEDKIGRYSLHDFFLYHMLESGTPPRKLYYMAQQAFSKIADDDEILTALEVFISRFFTQQFKRSCMPDGPKVGTVSLSPRGNLKMPSDASGEIWLEEVRGLR